MYVAQEVDVRHGGGAAVLHHVGEEALLIGVLRNMEVIEVGWWKESWWMDWWIFGDGGSNPSAKGWHPSILG